MMDWSNDVALELLQLYKEEPVIWNPRNYNHKNRNVVEAAWRRIQANMSIECTVGELKKKKDALMATFRRLYRKKTGVSEDSNNSDENFKSGWFAYDFMEEFLHDVYKPVRTTQTESPGDMNEIMEDANFYGELVDDFTAEDIKLEMPSPALKRTNNTSNLSRTSTLTSPPRRRKKCRLPMTTTTQNNINKGMDECLLFSRLVAKKLKRLDESTREVAMLEIDYLLYRLKNHKSLNVVPSQIFTSQSGSSPFLPETITGISIETETAEVAESSELAAVSDDHQSKASSMRSSLSPPQGEFEASHDFLQ